MWLITLQVAAFTPIDRVSQVSGSQRTYEPPAFVVKAWKKRNASRRKRRNQKRPQPVSTDESDALPRTLSPDEVETMYLLLGANVLSYTRPPVLALVISSLPHQGIVVLDDATSVLATSVPYDRVSSLVPLENPFERFGNGNSLSASASGEGSESASCLGCSRSPEQTTSGVSSNTGFYGSLRT